MEKIKDLYRQWLELQPLSARKQFLLSKRFTVDYKKQLAGMVEKGFIKRQESDGSWYVFTSQSV